MNRVRTALVMFVLLLFSLSMRIAPGEVAAAQPATTIRVMTYNIHVGVGMDKKLDLARVAEVINRESPDLVGLQEVDRGVERTGRVDQIAELARLTGMEYSFAHNLNYEGGQYGVAVLSRFPILAVDHRRYRNLREAERRGFLRAEVKFGKIRISFVTTHLDYQFDDGRVFETEQLLAALAEADTPLIVTGDFNDVPTGNSPRMMLGRFADGWHQAGTGEPGFTFPADKPAKRIDYIFCEPSVGLRTKRIWIVNTQASDHLPVVADIEFTAAAGMTKKSGLRQP